MKRIHHEGWLARANALTIAVHAFDSGSLAPVSAAGSAPGELVLLAASETPRARLALAVEPSSRGEVVTVMGVDGKQPRWLASRLGRLVLTPAAVTRTG